MFRAHYVGITARCITRVYPLNARDCHCRQRAALPNYFASVLKTKRDIPHLWTLSEGKLSAASRGMFRYSPRPLVLEIN